MKKTQTSTEKVQKEEHILLAQIGSYSYIYI